MASLLHTDIELGGFSIGIPNRLVVDRLSLRDRQGEEMFYATRISAKIRFLPLLQGDIVVDNIQLFGFHADLNRPTPDAEPNFQFLIDTFASTDSTKKSSPLYLRINSLLLRRGRVSYDVWSEAATPGIFNPSHISLSDIRANISLKEFSPDSLHLYVKRISMAEQSGLELQKLSLRLTANAHEATLSQTAVVLPRSEIRLDTLRLTYDSLSATRWGDAHLRGGIHPSFICPADLSGLVPALTCFTDLLRLEGRLEGTLNDLSISGVEASLADWFSLRCQGGVAGIFDSEPPRLRLSLTQCRLGAHGIERLFQNLGKKAPAPLVRLGETNFVGLLSGPSVGLRVGGQLTTQLGKVNTNLQMRTDPTLGYRYAEGSLFTESFQLGTMLGEKSELGDIGFELQTTFARRGRRSPTVRAAGRVTTLEWKRYTYHNITLDGLFEQGGFDGRIILDDPHGHMWLDGHINLASSDPVFRFQAQADHLQLHELNLVPHHQPTELSASVYADFVGNSIDNMIGFVRMDSLEYTRSGQTFHLAETRLEIDRTEDEEKRLCFTSPFLTALIEGDYSYRTLPASLLQTVGKHIPALVSPVRMGRAPKNRFRFDFCLQETRQLSQTFELPFTNHNRARLYGYVDDYADQLRIEGHFPSFVYDGKWFESALLRIDAPADALTAHLRATQHRTGGQALNLAMEAQAHNNELSAAVNWGNQSTATYCGRLDVLTRFAKANPTAPLQADIQVRPAHIVINDTIWTLDPARILVDSGKVCIDHFRFHSHDRYLSAAGRIGPEASDTLTAHLGDISIGYVFDVVGLKDVDFDGLASGAARAESVLDKPRLDASLHVKSFTFNDAPLGDMDIDGRWDPVEEGIFLDAHMREEGLSATTVQGFIYPKKKGLDLHIDADNTNLSFLQYYMKSIASDVRGRIKGGAHFYGGFKSLMLEGDVMADASLKFDILGTTFFVRDSVHMRPSEIRFDRCAIFDPENHGGRLSGQLRHRHFKNLNYRFLIDMDNMLAFSTSESPDMPFYGTVYATGHALLDGGSNGLNVDVSMQTRPGSRFTYLLRSATSAANNQFITFVDKTPRRATDSIRLQLLRPEAVVPPAPPIDIRLNLQVDATPDGLMQIVMDPAAGDNLSGRGSGNIRVEYFNKGDVKLFGTYHINQGTYKFSLQEVIRKDFNIQPGSSLTFNGNPVDATLDINASHTVNSVALSDLGINESFTQTNVKVNCLMNLTGNLTRPQLKFDIDLPNVSAEEREVVRSAISTDEEMNMQILYLLGIGKFYTYDYMSNRTGQSSSAMSSMLSSTLSGQLNRVLGQALNLHNWNFGTMLSTGEKGWTDVEVEGMLSGQLLNNRLLINGNFGYRDNPMAQTNFVGDFDVEWLLTPSGDIRLKAYNRTNDRYYTKTTLTTQGVGMAYKKDFDAWRDLLLWRSHIRARRAKEAQKASEKIQGNAQEEAHESR
ncbi:MAG: translocation/assembly module TamB domain-containing protein [Bacteroidaceae bacterium]